MRFLKSTDCKKGLFSKESYNQDKVVSEFTVECVLPVSSVWKFICALMDMFVDYPVPTFKYSTDLNTETNFI